MTAVRYVGPPDEPRRYVFDGDAGPVGGGGEGFVYRARRVADDAPVALKQLTTLPLTEWPRHAHRIALVEQVHDRHLGRHLDAFLGPPPFVDEVPDAEEFDLPYTVMVWLDGQDFAEIAADADLTTMFGWVRDVARAAGALHRQITPTGVGIVHRDIKPSNVRITADGAVLIDFGIARPVGAATTMAAGAPGWIPPETLGRGTPGARGDTWQVAGLAAWALLDEPPGALTADTTVGRLEDALRRRRASRPRAVARHLSRALAADPGDRPPDVVRWADDLVTVAGAAPRRTVPTALVIAGLVGLTGVVAAVAAGALVRGSPLDPTNGAVGSTNPPAATEVIAARPAAGDQPAAFPFGATVPVVVTAPDIPGAAGIRVQPLTGNQPAPGSTEVSAPVARRLEFGLTVDRGELPVTVVDGLRVQMVDAAGQVADEEVVPFDVRFADPVPQPESCRRYDPSTAALGPSITRWRVTTDAGVLVDDIVSRSDAVHLLSVARSADEQCWIGPTDRDRQPLQYWKRDGLLLGTLPPSPDRPTADCVPYDPASLTIRDLEVRDSQTTVARADNQADADRALAVARHHRRLCLVGRDATDAGDDRPLPVHSYWQ